VRSSLGRPLVGKIVTFRAVNAEVGSDSVATDSAGFARVEVTLGKQAGPALVTATVDSLQRQAALSVDPAAPVGRHHRAGREPGGRRYRDRDGRVVFILRVSAARCLRQSVPTADLARMIQKMRNRFNLQSQLLKMISVESRWRRGDGDGLSPWELVRRICRLPARPCRWRIGPPR